MPYTVCHTCKAIYCSNKCQNNNGCDCCSSNSFTPLPGTPVVFIRRQPVISEKVTIQWLDTKEIVTFKNWAKYRNFLVCSFHNRPFVRLELNQPVKSSSLPPPSKKVKFSL